MHTELRGDNSMTLCSGVMHIEHGEDMLNSGLIHVYWSYLSVVKYTVQLHIPLHQLSTN